MSRKTLRFGSVDIEAGNARIGAFSDDGAERGCVQVSIHSGSLSTCLYLDEFQAAKLSQELFESVQAIAASRAVSPAPTLEAVEA